MGAPCINEVTTTQMSDELRAAAQEMPNDSDANNARAGADNAQARPARPRTATPTARGAALARPSPPG